MANKIIEARLITRNDTSTNWSTSNPVLIKGEIVLEIDTLKLKVGDGINSYDALPYVQTSEKTNSITLLATNWVNNVYTYSTNASNLLAISYATNITPTQLSEATASQLTLKSASATALVIEAKTKPTVDIPIELIHGTIAPIFSTYLTPTITDSTLFLPYPLTSYTPNLQIPINYTGETTINAQININNLGAKPIRGKLIKNGKYILLYNGTEFVSNYFEVTIPVPTTLTITLPLQGITEADRALISPLTTSEEWGKVSTIETISNGLQITFSGLPNVELPIQISILR